MTDTSWDNQYQFLADVINAKLNQWHVFEQKNKINVCISAEWSLYQYQYYTEQNSITATLICQIYNSIQKERNDDKFRIISINFINENV